MITIVIVAAALLIGLIVLSLVVKLLNAMFSGGRTGKTSGPSKRNAAADWGRHPHNPANPNSPLNPMNPNNPARRAADWARNPANPLNRRRD
jgi:hypothetical protein